MQVNIVKYWDRIRSSFWFIPIIMAVGAVTLAFVTVAFDSRVTDWLRRTLGWTFVDGAAGASSVMGTIAGSMISIAGVVFSMTLVALSLASSQFGSRMLRNFMRDTTTQVVLGTFVATFLYCLLVLRTIRRVEEVLFVPHLSVLLGVVLAVVSVGVLIYFIHHVSVSLQANEIVTRVSRELIEGIDRVFPEQIGRGAPQIPAKPPDASFINAFDRGRLPSVHRLGRSVAVGHGRGCGASAGTEARTLRCSRPAVGPGLARRPGDRQAHISDPFRVYSRQPANPPPRHRVYAQPTG
jgi:uncharacterized membrane protein